MYPKNKKKDNLEDEDEELTDYSEDSDIPVFEKKTRQGKILK